MKQLGKFAIIVASGGERACGTCVREPGLVLWTDVKGISAAKTVSIRGNPVSANDSRRHVPYGAWQAILSELDFHPSISLARVNGLSSTSVQMSVKPFQNWRTSSSSLLRWRDEWFFRPGKVAGTFARMANVPG